MIVTMLGNFVQLSHWERGFELCYKRDNASMTFFGGDVWVMLRELHKLT